MKTPSALHDVGSNTRNTGHRSMEGVRQFDESPINPTIRQRVLENNFHGPLDEDLQFSLSGIQPFKAVAAVESLRH